MYNMIRYFTGVFIISLLLLVVWTIYVLPIYFIKKKSGTQDKNLVISGYRNIGVFFLFFIVIYIIKSIYVIFLYYLEARGGL